MSTSTAPYRPLLSEDEHSGEEDESPPVVKHTINKATRGGWAVIIVYLLLLTRRQKIDGTIWRILMAFLAGWVLKQVWNDKFI